MVISGGSPLQQNGLENMGIWGQYFTHASIGIDEAFALLVGDFFGMLPGWYQYFGKIVF